MSKNHRQYYLKNKTYSKFLESQGKEDFQKYVDYTLKYLPESGSFLDVGCGTGTALKMISKSNKKVFGIEISHTSVAIAKAKKINSRFYNGEQIPFKDSTFDVVGSFNVVEHTENPVAFLNENLRVVKQQGYLLVVCPNFFSITNGYHYHTRGLVRKSTNLVGLVYKSLWFGANSFDKMATVNRKDFHPDDDAVNATNPVDILRWSKLHGLETIYWSSQQIYKQSFINSLDIAFFKALLGACFFVFRKP